MPVGTNFDRDFFPEQDRDVTEKYLLGTTFESGYNEDGYYLTMVKHYQIYAADFIPLCLYQPQRGYTHQIVIEEGYVDGGKTYDQYILYEVHDVKIEKEGAPKQRRGKTVIFVKATIHLAPISNPTRYERGTDPYVEPWNRPPYNFKLGTVLEKEYAKDYFNTALQVPARQPLVNSAGVPLQVNYARPLTRISFSFNTVNMSIEQSFRKNGCVNTDQVLICGIWFYPYELKIDSIKCEQAQEIHQYVENENLITETINFWKNDVVLLADPVTFNRGYLNTGMHVRKNGGVHRLWTAVHNGITVMGTLEELMNLGVSYPQELTANLFLTPDGTGVTATDGSGVQIGSYKYGVVEEVIPFTGLFPTEPPFIWNKWTEVEPIEP